MRILNDREPRDSWGNLSKMGKDCMDYDECRRERVGWEGKQTRAAQEHAQTIMHSLVWRR